MTARAAIASLPPQEMAQRLADAEATIQALVSGQVDAVVNASSSTPLLLATAQQALRVSEERYRRIVETTNEGIWIADAQNQTTFMNLQMARMLGCESSMGVGHSVLDFLDDEGRASFAADVKRAEGPKQVEVRFVRADGTSVWALLETSLMFDQAGRYEGAMAVAMNITARKRTEAALRASEARFRRLWDSGVILITVSGLKGEIVEVNEAGLHMLGYSREELLSGNIGWKDLTPPQWHDADEAARLQLAATGIASPWEKELIRKDGTSVSILAAAAMLDGAEGIAIAVDLTDRKRAEVALLERMRLAALTADVAMLLTHDDALEIMLERCAEAIVKHLGLAFARIWTLDAASGMLSLQGSGGLLPLSDEPQRVALGQLRIGRMAKEGRPYLTDDVLVDARPGDPRWAGVTGYAGYPLQVNQQLVGALSVGSVGPISEPAYTSLRALSTAIALGVQRKLVTSARDVLESQLRQSQKMEAVGKLAGGIAHDFNNILSVILTCTEFLLQDLNPLDPARSEVEEIFKAGSRAAALTRQLLMFSRQQVLAPRTLDLADLIGNMDSMLRRVLGEDVELLFERGEAPACVRADPGSIEQVVMNLVVNARDAMASGGKLTIGIATATAEDGGLPEHGSRTRPGPQVVLTVTDTGSGMDPATRARIFEPFFTTKVVGKGTGLGLSTVFGIVQQSNGEIVVDSEVGRGTTFSIYLPRVDAEPDASVSTPRTGFRGTETVMLVEDEEQVRGVARSILQRHGYNVVEMRSPSDALAYCQTRPERIHLLLTDVVMPQMNGPELARRLLEVRPGLAVVCMSGYTDDRIVRQGVLENDVAFLQKPFTPESLTRKVREVLDAHTAH